MRFTVDFTRCSNHAQCHFAAPESFPVTDDGVLEFREGAGGLYRSGAVADSDTATVEEAAMVCPTQAIALDAAD